MAIEGRLTRECEDRHLVKKFRVYRTPYEQTSILVGPSTGPRRNLVWRTIEPRKFHAPFSAALTTCEENSIGSDDETAGRPQIMRLKRRYPGNN